LKHDQSAVSTKVLPINNFIAHLFDEIRLELGGVIVDRIKNPGITTTMKGYVSHTPNESTALINAGWSPSKILIQILMHKQVLLMYVGHFRIY
jgi:hypothetical protein